MITIFSLLLVIMVGLSILAATIPYINNINEFERIQYKAKRPKNW